jgi:phage terminase small subunit
MTPFDAGTGQSAAEAAQDTGESGPDVNRGDEGRALAERRENFCHYYILSGNAARAAINAGYSSRNARQQGSRLLTKADILARIAEMRRDLGLRNRIDRDTIMAKLEACYRGAMTGHMYFTAIRAAEAQARLAGLFPDRAALRAQARALAAKAATPEGADSAPEKVNGDGASHSLEPPRGAR